MFKPGEEVVCIDDTGRPEGFTNWVKKDESYEVFRCEGTVSEGQRVLLVGMRNPKVYVPELLGKVEVGFSVRRFKSKNSLESEIEEVMEEEMLN